MGNLGHPHWFLSSNEKSYCLMHGYFFNIFHKKQEVILNFYDPVHIKETILRTSWMSVRNYLYHGFLEGKLDLMILPSNRICTKHDDGNLMSAMSEVRLAHDIHEYIEVSSGKHNKYSTTSL